MAQITVKYDPDLEIEQIEEPMYNLADAVLNALDEYGYGENSLNGGGFDPTYYQDW